MKIKVCGMKYPENIAEISALGPDYMGFIFYNKSKRYAGETKIPAELNGITKVGVFVNEDPDTVDTICRKNDIAYIQLHGDESPEVCRILKERGYTILKVFSVGEDFDSSKLSEYEKVADYFLFDTKGAGFGGTGKKFDWSVLDGVKTTKEIFLSGGIGPGDAEAIKNLKGLRIHAIDINSCFEKEPGLKDLDLVRKFIQEIKS